MAKFSDELRDARRQAGLTQVKLAARLGVDPGAISGWERGIRMPDKENRQAIAAFMGLTVADFLVRYEAGGYAAPAAAASPNTAEAEHMGSGAGRHVWLSDEELRALKKLLRRLDDAR